MKRILLFILVASVSFYLGSVLCAKTGIKHTNTKIYDFTQERSKMNIYANIMGYELVDKKEWDNYRKDTERGYKQRESDLLTREHTIWQRGYEDGFKTGSQNKLSKGK